MCVASCGGCWLVVDAAIRTRRALGNQLTFSRALSIEVVVVVVVVEEVEEEYQEEGK
jgi:hypothetical protein